MRAQPGHRAGQTVRAFSLAWLALAAFLSGCMAPGSALSSRERQIAQAVEPLLTMNPDVVWTDCYNRLADFGPDSIDFLMRQPPMTQPAAPDDLRTLLHVSLIRLLAGPGAPHLTAIAYETSLDILHFEIKVSGGPVGPVAWCTPEWPAAWHDLYPAEFNHRLAARVDIEADRQRLVAWWRVAGRNRDALPAARRLQPRAEHLWRVLARRYADYWQYQPDARPIRAAVPPPAGRPTARWARVDLCVSPPQDAVLLQLPCCDYNLVRAACLWLASQPAPAVRGRLIELVASPNSLVAHNARFALSHSPDENIRSLIREHEAGRPPLSVPQTRNTAASCRSGPDAVSSDVLDD